MGLDCSHDAWSGAYSAFNRWRDQVARAAGYAIWPVIYDDCKLSNGSGFGRDTIMIDWGHVTEENLMGVWAETPTDPLIVLIAHSDCDGDIHPAQAVPLADRLEGLLPELDAIEAEVASMGHMAARGGLRGCTEKFITGLREAAAANEPLEFA